MRPLLTKIRSCFPRAEPFVGRPRFGAVPPYAGFVQHRVAKDAQTPFLGTDFLSSQGYLARFAFIIRSRAVLSAAIGAPW